MQSYEAILAQRDSVERVRAAQKTIARLGGSVKFAAPTTTGMVLVTLILPDNVYPDQVLPGMPFYPA